MINNNGDKKMKKILLSLYLVCQAIMPAYCDSGDAETLWYLFKMFLLIISPFVILFIIVFLLSLLLEWYASDVENHPERRLIVIIIDIILGILTLGTIWLNRRK